MHKRLAALAALITMFACLASAPAALAHAGNPDYRSEIDKVTPQAPGVNFEVLDYDSYMQLLTKPGNEVMIYGYEGEPYVRILKNGTVQVNKRSPALYLNENRFAEVEVPKSANAEAPPEWKTFDHSGTFVWHDHRMHYMSPSLPPQVKDKAKKTKVFNYQVPISVNGKKGDIDGTLYWVGPENTSKTPYIIAGIAIVLIGGGLVLFVRRRRGDPDEGDDGDEAKSGPGPEPAAEAW